MMGPFGDVTRMAIDQGQELELDLRQLWQALMRRKWIILLLFLGAAVSAYLVSSALTPIYEATTTVMIREQQPGLSFSVLQEAMGMGSAQSRMQSAVEVFRSRTLAYRTGQRLGYGWSFDSEEVEAFQERLSVQPVASSQLLRVSFQHEDPVEASRIANALVETYIELNQEMNTEDVRSARQFIESQLQRFEAELEEAEEALVRFKEESEIVSPSGETQAILETITRLEGLRTEAIIAREAAAQRIASMEGELGGEARDVLSGAVVAANPVISGIRSQLASLEAQLAAALEVYTERNPRVLSLQAQISQLRDQLNAEIARLESTDTETRFSGELIAFQAEIVAQTARIEALDKALADRESLLGGLPEKELHLARLIRNATVTESIYTMLLQRKEEMRISEAMETANVTILDPAITPLKPFKPRKMLNTAIAGFLGIFIGVGVAFLLEYTDTTFKDPDELESYLDLPILGRAPQFDALPSERRAHISAASRLN